MVKILLWVLFPLLAFALTDVDRQELVYKNLITNSGFENGIGGWSAGADTITSVTSGTNLLFGKGSVTWDSAGASRVFTHAAITIPKGGYGANGLCSYLIQVPSGTATHLIRAYDGTNVLASKTITSSTLPTVSLINFPMPASGTIQCQLVSVAANEPLIAIDDGYIGKAYNIFQATQATYYGGMQMLGNTNCSFSRNSAGTEGVFSADSDCNTPTVYGNANHTADKKPAISFPSLPPGHYSIHISTAVEDTASSDCRWYVTDGTTHGEYMAEQGALLVAKNFHSDFDYTSAQGATEFSLAVRHVSGGTGCNIPVNSSLADFHIEVYRFPTIAETIYVPEATNWHIDATIYNVANSNYFEMGSSDISSYTAPNLADLSMVINPGSIPAKITCSSTNPPTGLTCGAGNEEAGVNFDLPVAGDVEICAQFDHYADTTNGFIKVNFSWQETLSNSQSSVQDCGPATVSGIDSLTQGTHHPTHVCGICHFTSNGNKTIRLMRKQIHSGTVSVNSIHVIDQSAGQQQLRLIVKPLNQSVPSVIIGQTMSTRYYLNASTANSYAHNTVAIIDYNVKQWESNMAGDVVTTGSAWKLTSAFGGEYEVSAGLELDLNPSVGANLSVQVNGTTECYGLFAQNASMRDGCKVKVNAGDYIDVRVFQRNGGTSTAHFNDFGTTSNRTANYVEIKRVN